MRCLWFQVLSNLLKITKNERQFIEALFCFMRVIILQQLVFKML
jgi:hypothetical protein